MKRIKPLIDYETASIALTNYCKGRDISYNDLAVGITNIHNVLYTHGVNKNDHVAITNEETEIWAIKLAAIVTYGAVAVIIPNKASNTDKEYIYNVSSPVICLDEYDNIDKLLLPSNYRPSRIDITKFSLHDDIIIDFRRDRFGKLHAETTKVYEFMQLAETIKTRYSSLRHSRIPLMLVANQKSVDAKEVLAALSIGAHIAMAGSHPSSGTLLKCLKHYRPHFVYLDTSTAERLIRERVLPMLHNPTIPTHMMSSIARRNLLKQARKRMMFALGGCILMVSVTGGRFSPDIETFLQRIDFPYQII
jgi:long-chain acyl-CoA synthetase